MAAGPASTINMGTEGFVVASVVCGAEVTVARTQSLQILRMDPSNDRLPLAWRGFNFDPVSIPPSFDQDRARLRLYHNLAVAPGRKSEHQVGFRLNHPSTQLGRNVRLLWQLVRLLFFGFALVQFEYESNNHQNDD